MEAGIGLVLHGTFDTCKVAAFRTNDPCYSSSSPPVSPAGVIAVDLARQTLQVVPNTYALVVSTENITQNWYHGNQKSMLIPNTIFRMGAAAVLLTNKRTASW